jgi:hypothetical protein
MVVPAVAVVRRVLRVRVRVRPVLRVWPGRRGQLTVAPVLPVVLAVLAATVVPGVPVARRPVVVKRVQRVRWVWRPVVLLAVRAAPVVPGLTLRV